MALNFRKRIKLAPGVNLNISKRGFSATVGPKGANVNIGKKGKYLNTGIPGTGIYARQRLSSTNKRQRSPLSAAAKTGSLTTKYRLTKEELDLIMENDGVIPDHIIKEIADNNNKNSGCAGVIIMFFLMSFLVASISLL